jgi:hypothetical protein
LRLAKLTHIINPVKVNEQSDLFHAQPITFESIRIAQSYSKYRQNITLCTTQFEEDRAIIPPDFKVLSNLERSVLDSNNDLKGRKLPLIADILAKLPEAGEADYYVFTNMDIALMPYFYDTVFSYIDKGHDAIVINRRRIKPGYKSPEELPLMFAEMGLSHPGFDCFVFSKDLLQKLILENICVGISFLEVTLVHNLFSFARNPLFVPDAHLTFHIGMEVLVPRNNAFYQHNRNEFFKKIYPKLKPHFSLQKFPYASLPLHQRALKWMLNPSLFTVNYLRLEGYSFLQKIKARLDEIRWRILQK